MKRPNNTYLDDSINIYRVEDLIEELYSIYHGGSNYGFFSIDVVSMFDRIPMEGVKEVINLLDLRFNKGIVNKDRLINLISLDCNLFDFFKYVSPNSTNPKKDVRYFHQRLGIPMGGNTSNLYADIYVRHHLSTILYQLKNLGVLMIRKYVDDLLIYAPKENFLKIISIIQRATKLEFTMELPTNGNLPYLDLLIKDKHGMLTTQW